MECLRFLALKGLKEPDLFTSDLDKGQVLLLKQMYENGLRPLRGRKTCAVAPTSVANVLLLWLGSLPEPVVPEKLIPELMRATEVFAEEVATSKFDDTLPLRGGKVASLAPLRTIFKKVDPYVIELLFPLFELLHHYWINQPKSVQRIALQQLSCLFAGMIFGKPSEGGDSSSNVSAALQSTTAVLIEYYRPVFTEPTRLNRYALDAARQSQNQRLSSESRAHERSLFLREASRECHVGGDHTVLDTGSPLLTPRKLSNLSLFPLKSSPIDSIDTTKGFHEGLEAVINELLNSAISTAFLEEDHDSTMRVIEMGQLSMLEKETATAHDIHYLKVFT